MLGLKILTAPEPLLYTGISFPNSMTNSELNPCLWGVTLKKKTTIVNNTGLSKVYQTYLTTIDSLKLV